jgi:hypothetical protein
VPPKSIARHQNLGFRLVLSALYATGAAALVFGALRGLSYYTAPHTERPHLPDYRALRPGGSQGHAYGVVGSVLLLLLLLYSARKRGQFPESWGTPAQWLQVHICFGILGPLLVILHTSFKVQGLVAVSFWSMITVALSGIFGRWLYQQIPRNLAGRELTLQEIDALERELAARAAAESDPRDLVRLSRRRAKLQRSVGRLETIRGVFHWWHVVHKPVAIIMLLIMMVHVAVAVSLGYTWVF